MKAKASLLFLRASSTVAPEAVRQPPSTTVGQTYHFFEANATAQPASSAGQLSLRLLALLILHKLSVDDFDLVEPLRKVGMDGGRG